MAMRCLALFQPRESAPSAAIGLAVLGSKEKPEEPSGCAVVGSKSSPAPSVPTRLGRG